MNTYLSIATLSGPLSLWLDTWCFVLILSCDRLLYLSLRPDSRLAITMYVATYVVLSYIHGYSHTVSLKINRVAHHHAVLFSKCLLWAENYHKDLILVAKDNFLTYT